MASTEKRLEEKLDAILEQQKDLLEALLGSSRPGSAPGLIRRMDHSEQDRADLRRQIADLIVAVRTLEAAPGRAALSWAERVALGIVSLSLAGLGALVSRFLGGQHP